MLQELVTTMQDAEIRQAVGKRIKHMRKQRAWTQKELATRLDIGQPQLNKYESGFNAPPLDKLIHLARIFDTTVDYLVSGTEEDKVPLRSTRLLERFRILQAFNPDVQETVIKLIDALIVQNRVEGAMKPLDRHASP